MAHDRKTTREEALAALGHAQADLDRVRKYLEQAGPPPSTPTTIPPIPSTSLPPTTTVRPTTTAPPPVTSKPLPTTVTSLPRPVVDEAAIKLNWGAPIPAVSDEFNYVGAVNPNKWYTPGSGNGCWAGHNGNGRRCGDRSVVDGQKMVMSGLANGDTGLIGQKTSRQYGRWEARVRTLGASGGKTYHPVMLIWPQSDRWPQDGEYDFFENQAPAAQSVTAFMHYPHNPGNVQQIQHVQRNVDTSQWHNIAFEWTPDFVAGYIDGVQWFKDSGGATSTRRCIQCMPSGKMTVQLDNFHGGGMTPGSIEVDWVRVYGL